MFVARVSLQSSPEGRDRLLERLADEARTVPEEFDGCEFYVVSVDSADDHHVLLAEEWTDRAAFDTYQGSEHFAETLDTLKSCLAAPPNSAYYESELVGP